MTMKVFVAGERLFASDLNDNFAQAGGARGGDADKVFWENDQTVTASYEITAGQNAMTAGPIEIGSGVTVTVPSGSEWTIV
jgi:hypothetical protein